jgi:hypothetical protein
VHSSLIGHPPHLAFRGVHTVLPSSMSAWFIAPGTGDFATIWAAADHSRSRVAFDFGGARIARTRERSRSTFPSS